jgi:hypothetical protein
MVESNLVAGRQEVVPGRELCYGQSITDGSLGLLAVNRHPRQPLRVGITLAGYRPAPRAQIAEYGIAQDEAARTGIGSADPNTWQYDRAATTFEYTFAPYSITLFRLAPAASRKTQPRATASNSP